jgi:uncharacterized RDD family membrane protein YckC
MGNSNYAGFWRRFFALYIDLIIIYVFLIGIEKISSFFLKFLNVSLEKPNILTFLVWLLITLFYSIGMESSTRQATVGKIILGIKVTDLTGNKIHFGRSALRTFAKMLSCLTFGIGFFMAGFTKRKQALHDILTGCLLVKSREANIVFIIFICFFLFPIILCAIMIFIAGSIPYFPLVLLHRL